jgi:hypothetical protein
MENRETILSKVLGRNQSTTCDTVKKLLILYEERVFFIGDNCLKLDKLGLCKSFYNNSSVHINFRHEYLDRYKSLLKNNPNFDEISAVPWEEIDFNAYDLVICASYEEEKLLDLIREAALKSPSDGHSLPAVFSVTKYLLDPLPGIKIIFQNHDDLFDYVFNIHHQKTPEIYLSAEEKEWADNWLSGKGLKDTENLAIMIDSSTTRKKLLKLDVYFNVLEFLLKQENTKVLIFDEKNIGKEDFYKAYLADDALFKKIIFSKGLKFREDLCLLGSKYTKLILGPCTGLLHCASGIYNHQVREGLPVDEVAHMIVYTGRYFTKNNNTAKDWWGNSPLVNCLILKNVNGQKELTLLSDSVREESKGMDDLLLCEEYTSDMIIDFIRNK